MADNIVVEEGKVLSIASSKTAKGTFYRIEVEDLDTGDVDWFGLGDTEPEFGEDSIVSFEFYESDDGKYLNIDGDVDVIDLVEPKKRGGRGSRGGNSRGSSKGNSRDSRSSRGGDDDSGSKRGSRSGSRGGSSRGGSKSSSRGSKSNSSGSKGSGANKSGGTDWEAKDKRTALGFAREQAMKITSQMLAEGAIKLPAKAGEKMDAYLEYVDMFTARFLEQADNYLEAGLTAIYDDADDE